MCSFKFAIFAKNSGSRFHSDHRQKNFDFRLTLETQLHLEAVNESRKDPLIWLYSPRS